MVESARGCLVFLTVIGGIFAIAVMLSRCGSYEPTAVDRAVATDALQRADEAEAQGRHADAYEWRQRAQSTMEGKR